jgi:hypothetical protein
VNWLFGFISKVFSLRGIALGFSSKSMSMFAVLLILVSSTSAWAIFSEKGGPDEVSCSAWLQRTKGPIEPGWGINELWENEGPRVILIRKVEKCHRCQGKVVTCSVEMEDPQKRFYIRYAFNTQNGNVSLEDYVTGQVVYSASTQQYGLTKSGYVSRSVQLTNLKGGLLGDAQAFQIDLFCQASKW